MSTATLHYFVDTNLFIQCRPLEQLDWSPWDTFEEVRLIVSSPVLREIDYRKNKSNDRAGNRARATSAMFREMLNEGHKLVCTRSPRVVLCVELQHTYSRDLEHRLNYQERDDQLVGTVYEFARRHQGSNVRLLTHDTTPLFTAQGLGLTADAISDNWLLYPETTETEKELASLKAENARLKKAEPSFTIRCTDQSDIEVERYEGSYTWFEPLTDAEVDRLTQCLKYGFPLETNFRPREPAERATPQTVFDRLVGTQQVFTPATDEEIAKYRDEAYPQWLERCEQVLRDHHHTLQRSFPVLKFSILAANQGTRSATDALITIEARDNFQIKTPSPDNPDEEQDGEDHELGERQTNCLSRPPVAPYGQWRATIGGQPHGLLRAIDVLAQSIRGNMGMTDNTSLIFDRQMLHTPLIRPASHDPNSFYYKPVRPSKPQSSFSLECDHWRHDDGEEPFCGEIHVPTDIDEAKGALACRIQAGNLSKPASKLIPVQIEITHVSAFESARVMVETLVDSPQFRIKPSSEPPGTTGIMPHDTHTCRARETNPDQVQRS